MRTILTRHEQGAVHLAEGYAHATGKPGVVLVTSGPGGTNVVTGLTNAFMDSTPIVVFTGQVPTGVIGNDAFQEAEIVGITHSCTKHNTLVRDVHQLATTIKDAFYIASTGRPGPVLVDIPKDVATSECDFVYPDKDWQADHREWLAGVPAWKTEYPLRFQQEPDGELLPQFVCEQIYEVTKGDAIITTEVG